MKSLARMMSIALTLVLGLVFASTASLADEPAGYVFREKLTKKIYHYVYELDVGPGQYDKIRVHRVVREKGNGQPKSSPHAVMFAHGDAVGFEGSFLTSAASGFVPTSRNIAVYLAERNVDVWGIDFSWSLIPSLADYGFMADWGLQRDIDHLREGLAFAVAQRARGGRKDASMHLLGWSRGGFVGYALLDQESQLACEDRLVKGFIPVETLTELDPLDPFAQEAVRPVWCFLQAAYDDQVASGITTDGTGQLLALAAQFADLAPAEPSPLPDLVGFFDGYTNREFALGLGAQTYLFSPVFPTYHLAAGVIGDDGKPDDLRFIEEDLWLTFLESAAPVQPTLQIAETLAMVCENPEDPSPFDDRLGDVTVPALYVGADGGFGPYGVYSLDLLGSEDTSSLVIDLDEDDFIDFGHTDVFNAKQARRLVWPTILEWIKERRAPSCND